MYNSLLNPTDATKAQNRRRSNRAARRSASWAAALASVGGYRNDAEATFKPLGAPLCKVVPMSTGMRADGTPNRNVGPGYNR